MTNNKSLLNNLTVKSKLQALLFAVSLASTGLVSFISWHQVRSTLKETTFQHLTGVRVDRTGQFEQYFQSLYHQVELLAEARYVIEAMEELGQGFHQLESISVPEPQEQSLENYYQQNFLARLAKNLPDEAFDYMFYRPRNPAGRYLQYYYIANNSNPLGEKLSKAVNQSGYTQSHGKYQSIFNKIIEKFGFSDLLLIESTTGDVIYSVFKQTDYATNLKQGPYSQSGLAQAVNKVLANPAPGNIQIADFKPYHPAYAAPIAFMAAPIYSGADLIGILAIQIANDQINSVISEHGNWEGGGLGKTGEVYLVGSDHLMRSLSRFWVEEKEQFKVDVSTSGMTQKTMNLMDRLDTTIALQKIGSPLIESALGGQGGIAIIRNYRGKEVLTAYGPLDLPDLDWVILAEMELSEAYAPLKKLQTTLLIAGVVFLLLSAAIAAITSKLLLKPVRRLINSAEKIAVGELHTQIPVESNNEFGELGAAFNSVANNLRQTNQELVTKKQENKFLLHNILPLAIAERKTQGESLIADKLNQVTIVYANIVGVKELSKWMSPEAITALLTELVDEFDAAAATHGLERQKIFGIDYMAVCGLTQAILDQAKRAVDFTQTILNIVKEKQAQHKSVLGLSIGIHAGSVTAGVIGTNNFGYNLWGETVDLATQLYHHTAKNQILVTRPVYERIADNYTFIPYPIEISNFGEVETWTLLNVQKMEISQVELVQSSFAKVALISDQVGEIFYQRLFELNPAYHHLFKADMPTQQRKFMSTLTIAVAGLGNPEGIINKVQKLGSAHAGYGVKNEYYENLKESLLWALEQGLGEDFTPSVRAAWSEAYRFLSEIMKQAATDVETVNSQKLTTVSDEPETFTAINN